MDRVLASCPELSDTQVLQGELMIVKGGDPTELCQSALDRGLPLFAFGASRLLGHMQRLGIEHRHLALLDAAVMRRVTGWLWTAWLDHE